MPRIKYRCQVWCRVIRWQAGNRNLTLSLFFKAFCVSQTQRHKAIKQVKERWCFEITWHSFFSEVPKGINLQPAIVFKLSYQLCPFVLTKWSLELLPSHPKAAVVPCLGSECFCRDSLWSNKICFTELWSLQEVIEFQRTVMLCCMFMFNRPLKNTMLAFFHVMEEVSCYSRH